MIQSAFNNNKKRPDGICVTPLSLNQVLEIKKNDIDLILSLTEGYIKKGYEELTNEYLIAEHLNEIKRVVLQNSDFLGHDLISITYVFSEIIVETFEINKDSKEAIELTEKQKFEAKISASRKKSRVIEKLIEKAVYLLERGHKDSFEYEIPTLKKMFGLSQKRIKQEILLSHNLFTHYKYAVSTGDTSAYEKHIRDYTSDEQ